MFKNGKSIIYVIIFLAIGAYIYSRTNQDGLMGVVQSSQLVQVPVFILSLGTTNSSDYILVEGRALLDTQSMLALTNNPAQILFLGNQFVGKKIHVSGNISRDNDGRMYIIVKQRQQIEYL